MSPIANEVSVMSMRVFFVGLLCPVGLILLGACQKRSEGRDAGVDAQDLAPASLSMCCGGEENKPGAESAWCPMRCARDSDCPGECLCSCAAEECSVPVAFGAFGNSDGQCLSVEFLRKRRWWVKDGGNVH